MRSIGSKPWIAKTSIATKFGIVGWGAKEFDIWRQKIKNRCRHSINEINGCGEGI